MNKIHNIYIYDENIDSRQRRELENIYDSINADCDIFVSTSDSLCENVDIGLGEAYRGKAHFVVYSVDDIDAAYLKMVAARKMNRPLVIAENDRLLIRELEISDMADLYKLYDSLKDCRFIEPLYEWDEEKKFLTEYIDNMYRFFGYGLWLVYLKEEDNAGMRLVGRAGIEHRQLDGETVHEIGYLVDSHYQGENIATESCRMILEYAGRIGIDTMYACIDHENIPSVGLIEKLGFSVYAENVNDMNIYYLSLKDYKHTL